MIVNGAMRTVMVGSFGWEFLLKLCCKLKNVLQVSKMRGDKAIERKKLGCDDEINGERQAVLAKSSSGEVRFLRPIKFSDRGRVTCASPGVSLGQKTRYVTPQKREFLLA